MIRNYKQFVEEIFERAPSIPKKEEYWKKRGKKGKEIMLYFHDDMDGLFSAIVMKGWLEHQGFKIAGYGIINYQEGWTTTKLKPEYINIALDYAENIEGIDVYIDHHGQFDGEGISELGLDTKEMSAKKTKTSSAYEGICDQLGIPTDSLILSVIDMIDSAKYEEYNVDIRSILDFDPKKFKNKLQFAAAFNQLLKRSDYKTFIEVVANHPDAQPSIYRIFDLFKKLFPANNLDTTYLRKIAKDEFGYRIGTTKSEKVDKTIDEFVKELRYIGREDIIEKAEKPFLTDAAWRLSEMQKRTQGKEMSKVYIKDEDDFKRKFYTGKKVELPGYQILGQLVFVPSGTWANGLRARAVLEKDLDKNSAYIPTIDYGVTRDSVGYEELKEMDGQERELIGDISMFKQYNIITVKKDVTETKELEGIKGTIHVRGGRVYFTAKQPLFFILLQYGNTMQVCTIHKFERYAKEYLPKSEDGTPITDLGKYCSDLIREMVNKYGYTNIAGHEKILVPEQPTVAGGHPGIGTISNIFGTCWKGEYNGTRFLDLIKNRMIKDLSRITWDDLSLEWGDKDEVKSKPKEHEIDRRTVMADQIRYLNPNKKEED